jgi:hypothetical protein
MRNPLAVLKNSALLAVLPLGLLAAPIAAHAADFTFTGTGSSGTDPLGGGWEAGPNVFGLPQFDEPLVNNQFPEFEAGGGLEFATSFTFTITGGDESFDMSRGAGITQVADPQGTTWTTTYLSPTSVRFDAPVGSPLDPGDTFSLMIGLTNPVDPQTFSFTGTWSDGLSASAVPEPASWALMIAGFGLAGATLRRRNRMARTA